MVFSVWLEVLLANKRMMNLSVQRHTSESTVEDRELATTILRYYIGEVEDLGPHTVQHFSNFTQMLDDSFFLFATHRSGCRYHAFD